MSLIKLLFSFLATIHTLDLLAPDVKNIKDIWQTKKKVYILLNVYYEEGIKWN